jgi:hypothetical protein
MIFIFNKRLMFDKIIVCLYRNLDHDEKGKTFRPGCSQDQAGH